MVIKTELGLSLEELAMELIPPKQSPEKIVELLDHQSKKADTTVKRMAVEFIKSEKADVSVSKVEFTQMDSARLSTGAAFFDVTLKGTQEELEKVANVDLLFSYDWENPTMDGVSRKTKHNLTLRNNVSMLDGNNKKAMKKKVTKSDWTEPEWLNKADWHNLKTIKKYVDDGDFKSAMDHAMNCDTVIREEIPPDVWKKMGGQLTKTGEEKLKAMKSNYSKYDDRDDDLNPRFMFSTKATQLLVEALKGEFDINYLIRKELANRGQDKNGKWVGFEEAKKIHRLD